MREDGSEDGAQNENSHEDRGGDQGDGPQLWSVGALRQTAGEVRDRARGMGRYQGPYQPGRRIGSAAQGDSPARS